MNRDQIYLSSLIYQCVFKKEDFECDICNGVHKCHGIGPESMPKVRWIIRKLIPKDLYDELNKIAVPVHDIRFGIGNHPYNLSFEEINEEFRINVESAVLYYISKHKIKALFLEAIIYRWLDDLFYFFVSGDFGEDAFDSNGCNVKGGVDE